eukprot:CAMPEP_0171456454 /NCGR_PEP_ID=MMETSP0945-20130129/2930_1 /TAXON_ID=109269 /ORGANISM="Vaucheria litorea, Strain CCMP2940" /LENGTH=523 /DNA_ID=CAMNT_0011981873 /DNA_START=134 /DNA_END=1702 /DNA_ORIENTATION=+
MTSLQTSQTFKLIMSDEFEKAGRKFGDGQDPTWTAEMHSDDAMTSSGYGSMQYYNDTMVTTNDGYLNISTTSDRTLWKGYNPYKKKYVQLFKDFRSGMMTSWNKFCFTGGIIEMRGILPGKADIGGLWPAFWLLGNLGRATYEISTNLIWPWSYEKCNREFQVKQEISGCNEVNHFGLNPFQGRGSTEIDILEIMPGITGETTTYDFDTVGLPYLSGSLQVAPGITENRPIAKELVDPSMTWYQGMSYGPNTTQNFHFYGLSVGETLPLEPVYRSAKQAYNADGISSITSLNSSYFEEFHTYKLEWQPGSVGGYLAWYIDDVMVFKIPQESLDPFGSQIPAEPSYIIFNTAVASSWGFPMPCPSGCTCECYDCSDPKCACSFYDGFCDSLPAHFVVDYVRVYQNPDDGNHTQSCNPESHPTSRFIEGMKYRYLGYTGTKPLKSVKKGGGKCNSDKDCGNGICKKWWLWGSCKCDEGWVSSNCLAVDKYDDEVFGKDIELHPVYPNIPIGFSVFATALAIFVVL